MPRTRRCSAAVASTAQSIEQRVRSLLAECRELGGCPTGQARLTRGYRLPARYVIHTVGPVWRGGFDGEPALLAACYRNSLLLASEHAVTSIAFPAISTGIYRYPPALAARVALDTVRAHADSTALDLARFVCFDAEMLATYERELAT